MPIDPSRAQFDYTERLDKLTLEAEIAYWLIESDSQAIEIGFIGSPTLRAGGYDLIPVEGGVFFARALDDWPEGMDWKPEVEGIDK